MRLGVLAQIHLQEMEEGGPGWLLWLRTACPSLFLRGVWVICPTRRLLSPSLQVEPPRDLHKGSQPGIGSAQNCHSPQPCSADRTPSRRGLPAAGGAAEADPGADTPGAGAEVERYASLTSPDIPSEADTQSGRTGCSVELLWRFPPAWSPGGT